MIDGLTFDEASHSYRFNGALVPGVTSVLKPITDLSMVPSDILNAASSFGTAVHKACELDDLGTLDESKLDPSLRPYLIGWRKFTSDYQAEWSMVEERVFHRALMFAGTLDRFGKCGKKMAVVDIKSSASLYPSVGPQLAAYKGALTEMNADYTTATCDRIAVQLKGDGTYVAKKYTDKNDWPVFVSLLTLRNWCAANKVNPNLQEKA